MNGLLAVSKHPAAVRFTPGHAVTWHRRADRDFPRRISLHRSGTALSL